MPLKKSPIPSPFIYVKLTQSARRHINKSVAGTAVSPPRRARPVLIRAPRPGITYRTAAKRGPRPGITYRTEAIREPRPAVTYRTSANCAPRPSLGIRAPEGPLLSVRKKGRFIFAKSAVAAIRQNCPKSHELGTVSGTLGTLSQTCIFRLPCTEMAVA